MAPTTFRHFVFKSMPIVGLEGSTSPIDCIVKKNYPQNLNSSSLIKSNNDLLWSHIIHNTPSHTLLHFYPPVSFVNKKFSVTSYIFLFIIIINPSIFLLSLTLIHVSRHQPQKQEKTTKQRRHA